MDGTCLCRDQEAKYFRCQCDYGFVFYCYIYKSSPKSHEWDKSSFMQHWKECIARATWKILVLCFCQNWNSFVVSLGSRERLCSLWLWGINLERGGDTSPWPCRTALNLLPQVTKVYRVPYVLFFFFLMSMNIWKIVFFINIQRYFKLSHYFPNSPTDVCGMPSLAILLWTSTASYHSAKYEQWNCPCEGSQVPSPEKKTAFAENFAEILVFKWTKNLIDI